MEANIIDISDIGELAKELRTDKGWSQADVANKLWMEPQTVDDLENGRNILFVDEVSILQLLGVRIWIRKPAKLP